tara:strand:- start:423 stop:611 length:189 start_codon:yes stop_codon:yes gene_type:complete
MVLLRDGLLLVLLETAIVSEEAFACSGELEEDLAEVACGVADGFPEGARREGAREALPKEVG